MESKFAEGVFVYAPREGAHERAVCSVSINVKTFIEWVKKNPDQLMTGKEGDKILRLYINKNKDGSGKMHSVVSTGEKPAESKATDFKPVVNPVEQIKKDPRVEKLAESLSLEPDDDLPF